MGKKLFFDGAFYFEMHIAPVYLNCNEHKTYIYVYVYIYMAKAWSTLFEQYLQ